MKKWEKMPPEVPVDANPIGQPSGVGYPAVLHQNIPSISGISMKIQNNDNFPKELIRWALSPGVPEDIDSELKTKGQLANNIRPRPPCVGSCK